MTDKVTYAVGALVVQIFLECPEGMGDAELFRDDPALPEWVRSVEPGLYDRDGKAI
jgi:hypothetical protein